MLAEIVIPASVRVIGQSYEGCLDYISKHLKGLFLGQKGTMSASKSLLGGESGQKLCLARVEPSGPIWPGCMQKKDEREKLNLIHDLQKV
jgi:hypothetical protein